MNIGFDNGKEWKEWDDKWGNAGAIDLFWGQASYQLFQCEMLGLGQLCCKAVVIPTSSRGQARRTATLMNV